MAKKTAPEKQQVTPGKRALKKEPEEVTPKKSGLQAKTKNRVPRKLGDVKELAANATPKKPASPAQRTTGKKTAAKKAEPATRKSSIKPPSPPVSRKLTGSVQTAAVPPTVAGGDTLLGAGTKKPAKPGRDEIKVRVLPVIDAEAERNSAPAGNRAFLMAGRETLVLETDLNINGTRRRALCIDYSNISEDYDGGTSVGALESEAATTVAKAINLVHKMANGG